MLLSDIAVKRPVFAIVVSLLLVAFGVLSFVTLPVREMPEMDIPVVSIETSYKGASAEVIENRITKVIEDRIAGIEGIEEIGSVSRDGVSEITIQFAVSRDIEDAANDVRGSVSRAVDELPDEADAPTISKQDSDSRPIMWFTMNSESMNTTQMTDYAERYIVDRLAVLDGVARVRVGGGSAYAMRIWLDRVAMAARGLTVSDIQRSLVEENVELPAGRLESKTRDFSVRVKRSYSTERDFRDLVLGQGDDGHLIRLSEVADVRLETSERRRSFRGNGAPQASLGIIRQSTANPIEVSEAVNREMDRIRQTLPTGFVITNSSDSSVFVKRAIREVYSTLLVAVTLVVLVIFLFLGTIRASIIPAIVVPICLAATFSVMAIFDLSINLMTLLALVLSIGLVVDDSIVVLENIQRRVDGGEPALVAAYRGARQVGFAVIATTLVLISVFTPLLFLEGFVGRVFGELAIAISGAVLISSLIALTLSVVLCSKLLVPRTEIKGVALYSRNVIRRFRAMYVKVLKDVIHRPLIGFSSIAALVGAVVYFWTLLPQELAPQEDRGVFFLFVRAAEGTSYDRMVEHTKKVEQVLNPYLESGEVHRVMLRVPGFFGGAQEYNFAFGVVVLADWDHQERSGIEVMQEVNGKLRGLPGLRAGGVMPQALRQSGGSPVQFVLSGGDYRQLSEWAEVVVARAEENPGLENVETDYHPTKPQLVIIPNLDRTFDLGVSNESIGLTLQTMLGSRRVTTFLMDGEEYDVILQGKEEQRRGPTDLTNIFVRSDQTGQLIPLSNLIDLKEQGEAAARNRYNRLRSITIEASLTNGYSLGEALSFLEDVVKNELQVGPKIDYRGESRRFKDEGQSTLFAFALALLVVFLVLAAQFESFIHPLVIILTVPVAIAGALLGLYLAGNSINLYSQIGMIILIGIAAKNGILIVEFANQLRDQGVEFEQALLEASETRFRPIVMTGLSTAFGSLPLVLASGPGSASRITVGIVIFSGVILSTVMTLFIVPIFYNFLARKTGSPGHVARLLSQYEKEQKQPAPQETLAE